MTWYVASVQYDDFKGTAAADRADMESLREYLVANKLASDDEQLVGFRIIFSDNHGRELEKPGIVAYLIQQSNFDPKPERVRAVETNLTTAHFFKFLKRFDAVLLNKGMDFSTSTLCGPSTY